MHDIHPGPTQAIADASLAAHAQDAHRLAPGQAFIAADVGGTHARLGWVSAAIGAPIRVAEFHQYACAGYPSLAAILRDFADRVGARQAHAVIAIAGRLDGDELINSNLPWPVSLSGTRRESGMGQVVLINDFEAVAYAMPHLERSAMTRLCGQERTLDAPALVLGPGTGLGAALWLPGDPPRVLASEAGHAALAVGTGRELALLSQLLRHWPHVDNERVLSGPGLVNTYRALCELDGQVPQLTTPAEISMAAQHPGDEHAAEALGLFCSLLGSLAGDLALSFGAGTVYLAGGIPAQIKTFLGQSDFGDRFVNKGVLGKMLAEVPVYLVEHGQLGLVGAAAWYQEHYSAR
ncbi:MAG TPA: glucokinase [Stenotrophomonas sp.]|jgi:glucokinase